MKSVDRNRAAVLHAPGDLRLEERPVPHPGPGEVLVEVLVVGVCGSDVHYYEHGRIGQRVVRQPHVLGHEASGRVAAVGTASRRHRIGDRVCLEPGVPCGTCRECRTGRYNLCADVRFLGAPPVDGSLVDYLVIPEEFAHPLPDAISDEEGALIEPLAVAVWACQKANLSAGARLLVTGAGPIGLLVAQTAKAFGATEVVITDLNPARLDLAVRLGATATVDVGRQSALDLGRQSALDVGFEADSFIECSGSAAAIGDGIACLRPAGTAVLVGMGEREIALPVDLVQTRELWVTGTFRYANAYPAAIALAAERRVDLQAIITGRFGLEQAQDALRAARRDPDSVKALITP